MSNNKKIIYISSNILSRYSADVVCILEMCEAFSKKGFDTILLVPKFYSNIKDIFIDHNIKFKFNIKQIPIPKIFTKKIIRGRCPIFALLALRYLNKLKNTIFYSRDIWVFLFITFIIRKRCFYESHQFRYEKLFQTVLYKFFVKLAMNTGKGTMVCISDTLKKQFVSLGIDTKNIFVAHDCVNLKKYSNKYSVAQARSLTNIHNGKRIVIYTGSLNASKGVDVLIRAGNRLKDICFIVVGGTDNQIKKLKKIAKHNNILFTGYVLPKDIPVYQQAADILVLPNTKGSVIDDVTSPMKLFEYMAAERVIVSTDMPSIIEILKHEYNALISPAGDEKKLCENIKKLFNNPDLCKSLIRNAKKDLQNYTWDARVSYLDSIFSSKYLM